MWGVFSTSRDRINKLWKIFFILLVRAFQHSLDKIILDFHRLPENKSSKQNKLNHSCLDNVFNNADDNKMFICLTNERDDTDSPPKISDYCEQFVSLKQVRIPSMTLETLWRPITSLEIMNWWEMRRKPVQLSPYLNNYSPPIITREIN